MIVSELRQRQSLRNYLAGLALGIDPDWLDDDHFFIYDIITDLRTTHQFEEYRIHAELNRHALSDPDLKRLIEATLALDPLTQARRYLTLEDIGQNLPEITWFWKSWIPRGFLTTVAAEPGVGKTNIALDLSRRVIHRRPAPDLQPLNLQNSGNVIYIEAENFRAGLYERASAWAINMDRLFVFPQDEETDPDLLDLADHLTQDKLRDMCLDLHPDLIVIDSFSSIQVRSENSIEDTRDVLRFFGQLATHYNCAVVLLHHLRKPQRDSTYNSVTQHDLRGSSHLAAMSRSIIGMWVTSKSSNGPRRLQVIKSNLAPSPPPLNLTYTTAGAALFDLTFEQLEEPELPQTLTGQCAEWLKGILAEGPMSYNDLKPLAHKDGFSENTLQRARKMLDWQVADTIGPKAQGNQWVLANDQAERTRRDLIAGPQPDDFDDDHTCTHAACVTGGGPQQEGGGVTHAHVLHVLKPKATRNGHVSPIRNGNGHHRTLIYPKFGPLPIYPRFSPRIIAYPTFRLLPLPPRIRRQPHANGRLNGRRRR